MARCAGLRLALGRRLMQAMRGGREWGIRRAGDGRVTLAAHPGPTLASAGVLGCVGLAHRAARVAQW